MKNSITNNLIDAVRTVKADRHKMVILLGSFGSGKTSLLRDISEQLNAKYIDLNLELSERLLSVPATNYNDGVTVHKLIDEICDDFSPNNEILAIDNLELLFSPELGKINPVDTFKRISRQRPILLALPARRQGNSAVYSTPGNQDYCAMPLEDYIVIDVTEE